jgi:hypothetical protein
MFPAPVARFSGLGPLKLALLADQLLIDLSRVAPGQHAIQQLDPEIALRDVRHATLMQKSREGRETEIRLGRMPCRRKKE